MNSWFAFARRTAGLVPLLALTAAGRVAPPTPVHYTLSPVIEHGALRELEVGIDLRADPSGRTRLAFPDGWAGESRLGQWSEGFTVHGGTSVSGHENGSVEITSAPGAKLHVRYRVRSAYSEPPTVNNARQARPIITPGWFYAPGEVLFATPEGRDKAPAQFDWVGAPAGFGFASDLEHLAGRTRPARRPGTVEDVVESIVIGGPDLQTLTGAGSDVGVRVAAIGEYQSIQSPALADLAWRIIRTERQFWGDHGDPFLITLAPLAAQPGSISYSGAGRSDAFALWVGADTPLARLRELLAHEYFHTWNPGELGGFGEDGASERAAWAAEGFTDFYARRLALRSGLFELEDYTASWNETLFNYGVSPARNATEAKIGAEYWTNPAVQKLAYQRGAMLAVLFDAELRRASGGATGMDSVLRRMRLVAQQSSRKEPVDAVFRTAFSQVAGRPAEAEIARYELRGETLQLPPDAFGCLELENVSRPAWSQGFDGAASRRSGVFTGVDPTGPAYAAGLRDGMKRLELVSGEAGDSTVDMAYRVSDATGAERTIRYKPTGKTMVSFQRLRIPAGLTEASRKACIVILGGE